MKGRSAIVALVVLASLLGSVGIVLAQLIGGISSKYFIEVCQDKKGRLSATVDGLCATGEVKTTVGKGVLEDTEPPSVHLSPSGVLIDVASLMLDAGAYAVSARAVVSLDELGETNCGQFTCQMLEVGKPPVDADTTPAGGICYYPAQHTFRLSNVVQLSAPGEVVLRCVAHNFQRLGSATGNLTALPVVLHAQP